MTFLICYLKTYQFRSLLLKDPNSLLFPPSIKHCVGVTVDMCIAISVYSYTEVDTEISRDLCPKYLIVPGK